MIIRSAEYALSESSTPSMSRKSCAVSSRSIGSPAVEPYCNAGWPVLLFRKISSNNSRASRTGSDSLSVNPAASEINCGRDSATSINHEIAGASDRRPNLDNASCFIGNGDPTILAPAFSTLYFPVFYEWRTPRLPCSPDARRGDFPPVDDRESDAALQQIKPSSLLEQTPALSHGPFSPVTLPPRWKHPRRKAALCAQLRRRSLASNHLREKSVCRIFALRWRGPN